jgi:hypothetical protein
MDEIALGMLAQYLTQIPVLLAWLVGIILAIVYWRKHPRVSLLTLIAIVALLAKSLIGSAVAMWLPITLREQGWVASQIGVILVVIGIVQSLVSAVLWGLLLAAIFGWRSGHGGAVQNEDEGVLS